MVNTRNSDRLDRMDVIHAAAKAVEDLGAGHSVDLKAPDRMVMIEIMMVGLASVQAVCVQLTSRTRLE